METAWVVWFKTFGLTVRKIEDLADGQQISQVLHNIDPVTFRHDLRDQKSLNWVLRFNNLKRLFKLLNKFLATHNNQVVEGPYMPNLSAIAKDQNLTELRKLLQLVLIAALSSDKRALYAARIQKMPERDSVVLMKTIEGRMGSQGNGPTDSSDMNGKQSEITDTIDRLKLDETKRMQLGSMEVSPAESTADATESINIPDELAQLKRQYAELQNQFLVTENQLSEKVEECKDQGLTIKRLQREHNSQEIPEDSSLIIKLREEIESYKLEAENHRKLEVITEKYKKKLNHDNVEIGILEERVLQLEKENNELRQNQADLKELRLSLEDSKADVRRFKIDLANSKAQNSELETQIRATQKALKNAETRLQAAQADASILESSTIHKSQIDKELEASTKLIEAEDRAATASKHIAELQSIINESHQAKNMLEEELQRGKQQSRDPGTINGILATARPGDSAQGMGADQDSILDSPTRTPAGHRHVVDPATRKLVDRFVDAYRQQSPHDTVVVSATESFNLWLRNKKGAGNSCLQLIVFNGDEPIKQNVMPNVAHESLLREKDVELARHVDIQTKTRRLLKKQDSLIKSYRQKCEELQAKDSDPSTITKYAEQEEAFKKFRTEAKEREALLKEENRIVATAFFDLAARLQQSNLSLQRATATPRSFLSSKRLALGVLSPVRQR